MGQRESCGVQKATGSHRLRNKRLRESMHGDGNANGPERGPE